MEFAMEIELLVIPDCPHEAVADALIRTAMAETGVRASITRTVIATEEHAQERGFAGSPTILLNGVDPFPAPNAPCGLACRLYPTVDGLRGVPRLPDLRDALQRLAGSSAT